MVETCMQATCKAKRKKKNLIPFNILPYNVSDRIVKNLNIRRCLRESAHFQQRRHQPDLRRAQMAAFCYGDARVWRTCESMVLSSRGQPSLRFTSRCRSPDPQTENGRLSHHLLLVHRWWNETICFPKNLRCFWSAPKTPDLMERRYGTERSESQARHWRLVAGCGCVRMVCGQCCACQNDGEG